MLLFVVTEGLRGVSMCPNRVDGYDISLSSSGMRSVVGLAVVGGVRRRGRSAEGTSTMPNTRKDTPHVVVRFCLFCCSSSSSSSSYPMLKERLLAAQATIQLKQECARKKGGLAAY